MKKLFLNVPFIIFFVFMVTAPLIFAYYLLITILSGFLAYFMAKEPGVIDIGMKVIKPLAQFKIGDRFFRIQFLPLGVTVNNDDRWDILIRAATVLLILSFLLCVCVYYIDGWPDLDNRSLSPLNRQMVNLDSPGTLSWKEKFGNSDIRILGVMEDSPASHAGLRYGDIITFINGKQNPSLLEAVRLLSEAQQVHLRINRFDEKLEFRFAGDSSTGKNILKFGFDIATALKLKKEILVKRVKYRGAAHLSGVKPGDIIIAFPLNTPYLSEVLLWIGLKDKKYHTIFVKKSGDGNSDLSSDINGNQSGIIRIPPNKLNGRWLTSLEFSNCYYTYKPTLWESIKFSFSRFFFSIRTPSRGKNLQRFVFSPILYFSSHDNFVVIKKMIPLLMAISSFLLILGIIGQYTSTLFYYVFLIVFWVYILGIGKLHFGFFDTVNMFLANLLPYGDFLCYWSL